MTDEWMGYHDAGWQALAQRRFAEAQGLFERACQALEFAGSQELWLASTLRGLATAYLGQGDVRAAAQHCERALAINERLLGTDDPALAAVLLTLFAIQAARGQ